MAFHRRVTQVIACILVAGSALLIAGMDLVADSIKNRIVEKIEAREFANDHYRVRLSARKFAQGEVIYLDLQCRSQERCKAAHFYLSAWGKKVSLQGERKRGWDGLLPVGPTMRPGLYRLNLFVRESDAGVWRSALNFALRIEATAFPQSIVKLTVPRKFTRKLPPQTLREIAEQGKKINAAFRTRSERQWQGPFGDARELAPVTSPFYQTRLYNGIAGRPHTGVDLSGTWGEPVRAIQDGTVVLAEDFFYEGKIVIVDHGEEFFSYYQHLSLMQVKTGAQVRRGTLLGYVGSSGVSTGPHLHLSVRMGGQLLSPLSLLPLPVREK